jgi:hypothetical protein
MREACWAALRHTGLDDDRATTFVTAVNKCVTKAIRHGVAHVVLVLIDEEDVLVAEITTRSPGVYVMTPDGVPVVGASNGPSPWLVEHLVDRITLKTRDGESTVCLELARTPIRGDQPRPA